MLCDEPIPDHIVNSFFKDLEDSILLPVAPRIAGDLGPLLLMTTEDTLALVLETVSVIVAVQNAKWLTTDLARSIVSAVLQVWVKFNKGGTPVCYETLDRAHSSAQQTRFSFPF